MKLSSIIGLAVIAGAAAAGYAYFKNYKKVHEDLESDFHEFEDENDDFIEEPTPVEEEKPSCPYDPNKKYTSLNCNKDEFVDAARNTFTAAKGMIPPVKNIAKDVADIIQEKASDANVIAGDYVNSAKDKAEQVVANTKSKLGIVEEDVLNGQTTDDVIIDIDVSGNIREEE